MKDLSILETNRDALLLAEAVGWLHDYRKCSDEQLRVQAKGSKSQSGLPRNYLEKKFPDLLTTILTLLIEGNPYSGTIADLLNDKKRKGISVLGVYLSRCHNSAHFDKQDLEGGEQSYPGTKISTPFGYEKNIQNNNLTSTLWTLPWDSLTTFTFEKRGGLRKEIEELFIRTVADTRRPINEVDLWSWGLLTGSLYKAALAETLLTGIVTDPDKMRWRLLTIRIKGLDYMFKATRVPDILARKQLLKKGLDRVQEYLETTYPLGSEVYRDENGSVFVVPDLGNLVELPISGDSIPLKEKIFQIFRQDVLKDSGQIQTEIEIFPDIQLESDPWWGQDPDYEKKTDSKDSAYGQKVIDEIPKIGEMLSVVPDSIVDPEKIRNLWEDKRVDVCMVCGLRPQMTGTKFTDRRMCEVCADRRESRSRNWVEKLSEEKTTIWMAEATDISGRLALITGKFHLENWLNGKFLKSLFVIPPDGIKGPVTKTASFSRLRRIWETTRRFWEEAAGQLYPLVEERYRLKIYLKESPKEIDYLACDLLLGSEELDVIWIPHDGKKDGYLLSASNLSSLAFRLAPEKNAHIQSERAALYVQDEIGKRIIDKGICPTLRNSDNESGSRDKNLLDENDRIVKVEIAAEQYIPVISLLAEPSIFMVLVPADQAFDIALMIRDKYQTEMGKVSDRLPLNLGIVYAHYRIPLRSVMEAGRAMLRDTCPEEVWTVKDKQPKEVQSEDDTVTLFLERKLKFLHSSDEKTDESETDRKRKTSVLSLEFPLKMGDGNTKDYWYPYVFRESSSDSEEAQVIYAEKVECGDEVHIWPSTFDFEFLESSSARFAVRYDSNGRRPRRTRPFYLNDLPRLKNNRDYMQKLTTTQRNQVVRTIENKRADWFGLDKDAVSWTDKVFFQFVGDTLAGADWPKQTKWHTMPEEDREELIKAGVRGELADLAELDSERWEE